MRIVGRNKLHEFSSAHADVRGWIENWVADVEASTWKTTQDIKTRYASASFLKPTRLIFNVKGNSYRLQVTVAYKTTTVFVVWLGTHAEYDQRNKKR